MSRPSYRVPILPYITDTTPNNQMLTYKNNQCDWTEYNPTITGTPYLDDLADCTASDTLQSIGVGNGALGNNVGTDNLAFGYNALYTNSGGTNNLAFGTDALYNNTDASNNLAIGNNTLENNTSGNYNLAVGNTALSLNTTGTHNTAVGWGCMSVGNTLSGA